MRFTGYDLDQRFVFSKNAFPITIRDIEGVSIDITITYRDADYSMTLSPDSSQSIELDMQEILRSLAPKAYMMGELTNYTYRAFNQDDIVTITASGTMDEEISANLYVFDGGIAASNPTLENHIWLTWRPEVCTTYPNGSEELFAILNPYAIDGVEEGQLFRFRTLGKVYLSNGEDVVIELSDGMISTSGMAYKVRVNVSASRVGEILHNNYSEYDINDIAAYDVYGEFCTLADGVLQTGTPAAQRFILKPGRSNIKCFMFRNSLGVADTVYSTGSFTRIVSPDVATFISGRIESELTNKSKGSFKVNTGRLDSEYAVNLWQDFFMSDERFISEGGQMKRIIVEEGKSEAILQQLADMEFSYHLAEQPVGRYRDKKSLNTFRYE